MITFSILSFILITVILVTAIIALVCGVGFIMVFGDAIVCCLIVWLLIKLFKWIRGTP